MIVVKFPKKAIFKLRDDVVKTRAQELEEFMNSLCYVYGKGKSILDCSYFCDFIAIQSFTLDMIK